MRKIYVLLFVFLFIGNSNLVHAEDKATKPESSYDVKKLYLDNGFTEVNEAIKKTEDLFKKNLELPTRVPSITFTHIVGSFSSKSGVPNLEISYLDENSPRTRFKILVSKTPPSSNISKKIRLEDGNELLYYNHSDFDVFVVEKKELGYTFMIDKESSKKITMDGVVKIVNSME
ncbi:hypothetical protein [Lysinibacillus sp. NPDC092081]|uniref:hypothetical protein n=1 Tax=Lysinibacillus sp. NPDC092081 TaxID=3364131 RepID=UPI003803E269